MKDLVIGIDIGGTFTKFGFVDIEGNILAEGVSPTDMFNNADDYLHALVKEIEKTEKHINSPFQITGVGIGAPNANYHMGTIENAANLNWEGVVPLAEMVKARFGVPVKMTNDANAAALGEMLYGAARGMRDFIMITLGTGLGSGIVVNGELVYGHDGFAGEIGHVKVISGGRKCGCGHEGCLETFVSAPGIKRTVFELLARNNGNSELAKISFQELTSEMIYQAAKRNDPLALEAFEISGQILGRQLADSVAHTSPEAIFLFGGLAKSGDFILNPARKSLEENLISPYKGKVKLLLSGLMGKNVAILGAAALIWKDS